MTEKERTRWMLEYGKKVDPKCFESVPAMSYCDPQDYEDALRELDNDVPVKE